MDEFIGDVGEVDVGVFKAVERGVEIEVVNLTRTPSALGGTRPSISALCAQPRTSGRRLKPLFVASAVRCKSYVAH